MSFVSNEQFFSKNEMKKKHFKAVDQPGHVTKFIG